MLTISWFNFICSLMNLTFSTHFCKTHDLHTVYPPYPYLHHSRLPFYNPMFERVKTVFLKPIALPRVSILKYLREQFNIIETHCFFFPRGADYHAYIIIYSKFEWKTVERRRSGSRIIGRSLLLVLCYRYERFKLVKVLCVETGKKYPI